MRYILLMAALLTTALVSRARADEAPRQTDEAATATNAFAVDLYGKLRAKPGNLFFSPFSIETAMAMTWSGAGGETSKEMAGALHFQLLPVDKTRERDETQPSDQARVGASFGTLLRELQAKKGDPFQLTVANDLWGQKRYHFNEAWTKDLSVVYHSALHPIDFAADPEAARAEINAAVAKETQDKIKDLMPAGSIEKRTCLVLTNAIYFKASWQHKFEKDATKDENFATTSDKSMPVAMMHGEAKSFGYFDADGVQAVELPYQGTASMVILLPKDRDGLAAVEKSLTADVLAGWLKKLVPREVQVTMPKFKASQQFELRDALAAMGMASAFTDRADFSGISETEKLQISAVVHKATIDVTEQGTEAAAATGVSISAMSMRIGDERVAFVADHPFIYLIRDTRSGAILFMGRLTNPE